MLPIILCGGNCAVWSSGVPMLRTKIDRGVNLRPWTVTWGWSAGGGLAVCAQPKLTLGPKTAAALINTTSITRPILSFMVASTMVNQDAHCTPYFLELTVGHLNTHGFRALRARFCRSSRPRQTH